ncbi:MAG: hypothetical protein J7M32_04985 [Deltaproteobacteria bacterium]|nr:hypothetical protein [Deltaproteobacteria bacterium]
MGSELKQIETVSDVGFLLTRLRLAKRKNESDVISRIVQRLREVGALKEEGVNLARPFENLRAYVDRVLKKETH